MITYESEWARVEHGPVASRRRTTSSRTPGRVNRGSVYVRAVDLGELRLCTCGNPEALHGATTGHGFTMRKP